MDAVLMDQLLVLITVIGIDLALSADNAVVIGLAAATLPPHQRTKVIVVGTLAAALLRMGLAFSAVKLLGVVGLMLAGGLLLLYVAWKLWWDVKGRAHAQDRQAQAEDLSQNQFHQAVFRIVLADLSMSIENVLAVAGAARHHTGILIAGLALSVLMTGAAAKILARLLDRHHWVGYVGVGLIVWVSLRMIWDGGTEVLTQLGL